MKRYVKISLTLLIIALMAVILYRNKKEDQKQISLSARTIDRIPVVAGRTRYDSIRQEIELHGRLQANRSIQVISETAGEVQVLYAEKGMKVSKGQAIARVEDRRIRLEKELKQHQLDHTLRDLERIRTLAHHEAVTRRQLEEMELRVAMLKTELRILDEQLKKKMIESPIDGVISKLPVEQGAYISPGQVITEVIDISTLKMELNVPAAQLPSVFIGQQAYINPEIMHEGMLSGEVTFISPVPAQDQKYPVELKFINPRHLNLRPGMFAEAILRQASWDKGVLVPRGALVGDLQSPEIFRVDHGVARKVSLVCKDIAEDHALVISGIRSGDVFVLRGQFNLQDSSLVKIIQTENW